MPQSTELKRPHGSDEQSKRVQHTNLASHKKYLILVPDFENLRPVQNSTFFQMAQILQTRINKNQNRSAQITLLNDQSPQIHQSFYDVIYIFSCCNQTHFHDPLEKSNISPEEMTELLIKTGFIHQSSHFKFMAPDTAGAYFSSDMLEDYGYGKDKDDEYRIEDSMLAKIFNTLLDHNIYGKKISAYFCLYLFDTNEHTLIEDPYSDWQLSTYIDSLKGISDINETVQESIHRLEKLKQNMSASNKPLQASEVRVSLFTSAERKAILPPVLPENTANESPSCLEPSGTKR